MGLTFIIFYEGGIRENEFKLYGREFCSEASKEAMDLRK